MSYTPHTWVNNETITAAKLNNIEDGVQEAAQSGGGGYDAEFTIYHSNNSSDPYVLTRVSGDFATLKAMYDNGSAPIFLVRVNDNMGYTWGATTTVALYDYSNNFINLFIHVPLAYFYNGSNTWKTYGYVHWNNDDTITMS